MRIHGMMVVKNEEDIIECTLRSAARWCDQIYILDNESSDSTWEIVNKLAELLPQVVPFQRTPKPYINLRSTIARHYHDYASDGDWWAIVDADEFCVDDPHSFLSAVPAKFKSVWKQEVAYLFTEDDLANYQRDPVLFEATPISQRFRYYCADHSEIRFFRHSSAIALNPWAARPIYPRRIRIKHFQYRSPSQIQKRLDTRREIIRSGQSFLHESRSFWATGKFPERGKDLPECDLPLKWQERVVPTAGLHYDNRDGTFEGAPWTPPD